MEESQKQKVKELIQKSIFIEESEREYWLKKVDSLNEDFLADLEKVFVSEKEEFKKFLTNLKKYDPDGKILKGFKKVIRDGLKSMRSTVERKDKKAADEGLEEALKNV